MTAGITLFGTAALALGFGLRHGLDADHLAAIDGMTRLSLIRQQPFAPYCGALFSAGHGTAVLLATSMLVRLSPLQVLPAWLEPTGKILSAGILLLVGVWNLLSLLTSPATSTHAPTMSVRTRLFAYLLRLSHPWQIALTGMLFAISFDALGFAVLFATNATILGSTALAAGLAGSFGVGMVVVDTANGLWFAQLARRSGCRNATSRAVAINISLISLSVAAAMAASILSPPFDHWLSVHALVMSVSCLLLVAATYFLFNVRTPTPARTRPTI